MLKNHIKIALRQLKKQKFYSGVNILGLAIGVACCLLVVLFIKDELSYDQHHPKLDNLYRIGLDINFNDWKGRSTAIPPILTKTLVEEIPEVENAARFNPHFENAGSNLVRRQQERENQFEEGFVYADQAIFELFHLPLANRTNQSPSAAKRELLTQPNTVVITERMARKYFGDANPVGELLVLNDDSGQSYKITGVIENLPRQSHFQYDFFLSMPSLEDSKSTGWIANNYYAYVTLTPGTDPASLEGKLRAFSLKNFGPQFKEFLNTDFEALERQGQYYRLFLQPMRDVYLKSEGYVAHGVKAGDIRYVWLFGAIAMFILLIALANFINLSTARSANRAKEVGLRKVLGSFHRQLIGQFLTESVLMSVLAFVIGTVFASVLLPFFNTVSGKVLNIPFTSPGFWVVLLAASLTAGLLAGLYPSFYLSGFQPVKVLKGKLNLGAKSGWLRSGLVVFQFAISIGLIVATCVVYQQMNFIQNKKLGFEKEQVLLIEDTYTISDQLPAFKAALKKLPEAKNVTVSSYLPLEGGRRNSIAFYPKGKTTAEDQVLLQLWRIDEDYINTLGMNLIDGRNFLPEMRTDSQALIVNETAVKAFGLGDNPIGKELTTPFDNQMFKVIGVVEDFHFEGLKRKVSSVAFSFGLSSSVVSVKSTAAEMEQLIAKSEDIWKSIAPAQPFRYNFLDDRFATMYRSEDRAGKLFFLCSVIAIFIACLGLLALATFMTEQRMKEIGIRKVLGASVPEIVFQLSKKFLGFVFVGLLLAVPIAWTQMARWLDNFVYRIEVEWWMFALSGALAIGIAFLTVGFQSMRAALVNPVESLRSE